MRKFEYLKVSAHRLTILGSQDMIIDPQKLNEFGAMGWELVTFTFNNNKLAFGYFKKEIV